MNGMSSVSFPLRVGLSQDCAFSPFAFLAYIDSICRLSLRPQGVNIGGIGVNVLLFADDGDLLAQSRQELQSVLDRFDSECRL